MENPLLKRLLGEADYNTDAEGRVWPQPSPSNDVERHLSTLGAGVPPVGRMYPERPPSPLGGGAEEEKNEVQIGQSIQVSVKQLRDQLISLGHHRSISTIEPILARINSEAVRLVSMHTPGGH